MDAPNGVERILYPARRQREPKYWQFIYLTPTAEAARVKTVEQLINADAASAWCTECGVTITHGRTGSSVSFHMQTKHSKDLVAYENARVQAAEEEKQRRLSASDLSLQHPAKRMRTMTSQQKDQHRKWLAVWIARSMRPLSIIEDKGLEDHARFLAAEAGDLEVKLPGRADIRVTIKGLAQELRASLISRIDRGCEHYSLTTDLWSDRSMRSFIALTLHYVDDHFTIYSWVLGVQKFSGKHDHQRIKSSLATSMETWRLEPSKCALLLRDGAANAVAAGRELGVPHMSCIAHALNLVVGGALTRKPRRQSTRRSTILLEAPSNTTHLDDVNATDDLPVAEDEDCVDPEGIADAIAEMREAACIAIEDVLADYTSETGREALEEVRSIVARFRAFGTKFHRSGKARDRFASIQAQAKVTPTYISLDCPTRWNSAFLMLQDFGNLRSYVCAFQEYLKTPVGRVEFPDHATYPALCDRDWFMAKCLRTLLVGFFNISTLLGGDGYPTLVAVMPCLRTIEEDLRNPNLFDDVVKATPGGPMVADVLRVMNRVRRAFLELFTVRFREMKEELAWLPILDPGMAKMGTFTVDEKLRAKASVVDALIEMAKSEREAAPASALVQYQPSQVQAQTTPQKDMVRRLARLYGSTAAVPPLGSPAHAADIRDECANELEKYILFVSDMAGTKTNLLSWWRRNGDMFPRMRKLARKWLGCVATSVPCERAFSTSGHVVSARRTKLKPDFVEDLMFIAHNYE